MVQAKIHSFETFGAADGPGVRFIAFLSGCPLRCAYCHNPDTWARDPQLSMTAEELLAKALRYRAYWGDDGGVTISGGEPLLQIDFLIEFFEACKREGVSTCIDTSLAPFTREPEWFAKFERLMKSTDLLLVDIKAFDAKLHRELTGRDNANILDGCRYLSDVGKDVWIRHVLVPGVTDVNGDTEKIAAFMKTLKNIRRVDVLPYHTLGVGKWKALGIPYRLETAKPPTEAETKRVRELLGAVQ